MPAIDALRQKVPLPGSMPALDGVRGLAIVGVLACHFFNAWPVRSTGDRVLVAGLGLGSAGATCFFVLLRLPHHGRAGRLARRGDTGGAASSYAERSGYPLYYVVLLAFALLGPKLGYIDPWTFGRWGFWYWTYLGNWAYAARQVIPPLSHFWSLGVEEQFYLFWPLVVFVARGRRLAWICAALVLASPVLRAIIVYGSSWPVGTAFRVTVGRLDGLAMGALLAVCFRSEAGRALAGRAFPYFAVLGTLAFCAMGAPSGFDMHTPAMEIFSHSLLSLAFAGLLAGAVAGTVGRRGLAGALVLLLSVQPLRGLGRLSYGLYVLHYFVHVGALRVLRARPASAALLETRAGYLTYATAGVALSLALAWLSFELLEKRFLALKEILAPRRGTPAAS